MLKVEIEHLLIFHSIPKLAELYRSRDIHSTWRSFWSCVQSGVALSDPCGSFPTQGFLWFNELLYFRCGIATLSPTLPSCWLLPRAHREHCRKQAEVLLRWGQSPRITEQWRFRELFLWFNPCCLYHCKSVWSWWLQERLLKFWIILYTYICVYVCIYTRTYICVIYMLYMFIYIYVCIYDISKHSSSGKSYAWMRVVMNRSFKGLIPLPRLIWNRQKTQQHLCFNKDCNNNESSRFSKKKIRR